MVDTFNIPAIMVGSLLGLLICVLVGAVVYNICKRRKMFADDKEPARPKVYPAYRASPPHGDLRLLGPPSGQAAGDGPPSPIHPV
ncbi:hypothetical protein PoB_006668800 [Plakobranchus ocellatus]|uniref:Uncharacterized protein n=1 Tax=Plakobranchus ocellatus TaxID=259542 RepID=A0AAV4D7I6_9GAST|nr:hypothetical protein PoB_006668800 [Plakobranchus ocellatus]